MPPGRIASAVCVPASPSMHARTVPSPPATNTTAAPSSTACFACPVPGSSAVVSSHAGSGQPASASCSTMPARSSSRPSTRFGLTITAVRSGPLPSRCSAAGWVVASWGVVTGASMSRGSPTGHSGTRVIRYSTERRSGCPSARFG